MIKFTISLEEDVKNDNITVNVKPQKDTSKASKNEVAYSNYIIGKVNELLKEMKEMK